jgi:glycosyltransferase involved in cell wall biosynthesis
LPYSSVLLIMGSGPLEQDLKRLASELGIADKVWFAGQVPNGRRYFRVFDVFALTSDHEPFGMVLLEAMAAGLPIICSDSGGGAEVARDVGVLFALGDDRQLAECFVQAVAGHKSQPTSTDQYLRDFFSDDGARQRFRALPFICIQRWMQ